jgi:hypothetical protein
MKIMLSSTGKLTFLGGGGKIIGRVSLKARNCTPYSNDLAPEWQIIEISVKKSGFNALFDTIIN